MTRIYQPSTIITNGIMQLDDNAFNHIIRVLRMREGDNLTLFDGHNYTVNATIHQVTKKALWVKTADKQNDNRESPLNIHLGQAISRGEKMEFTIQKSVELGVNTITPLLTERCGVKLDTERLDKKLQQWQKIAESACEQCGRNIIPVINPIIKLEAWCAGLNSATKITLHPRANHGISGINLNNQAIALLIGPEGGLSDSEIAMTLHHQFIEMSLGPRVLRTETAALTALSALQVKFGDLG